jgi:hypothetical protein
MALEINDDHAIEPDQPMSELAVRGGNSGLYGVPIGRLFTLSCDARVLLPSK